MAGSQSCIYCDGPARSRGRGEHIIPESIGGGLTIVEACRRSNVDKRLVCSTCNNRVLSQLDTELCSRSPLAIVAMQEIDGHLWQIWSVDEADQNLLLEIKSDWANRSFVFLPQLIFDTSGPKIRGEPSEMREAGWETFQRILVKAALNAFRRGWIQYQKVDPDEVFFEKYRLAPRVFFNHTIQELGKLLSERRRATLILRYQSTQDKNHALRSLANWSDTARFREFGIGKISAPATIRSDYDMMKVTRALFKTALNLLAAYCPNTTIDRNAFGTAIRLVTGERRMKPDVLKVNGFVRPADVASFKAPQSAHSFRIQHDGGAWHVHFAFFGGRIGAFSIIPGPNNETWCRADVVAPLHSKQWTISTSRILCPMRVHIEWHDPTKIIPSAEILNPRTIVQVIRKPAQP